MSSDQKDLAKLISRFLDQELSLEESVRLNALLSSNEEARREYLELVEISALLDSELARPLRPEKEIRHRFSGFTIWLLALAATVAICIAGATLWHWPTEPVVARIGLIGSAERFHSPTDRVPGAPLRRGDTVAVNEGMVQVAFESGARIVLQGKGEIVIEGSNQCRMITGSLAADVPEAATGFTVETVAGAVRDLGTQFLLGTEDQETFVLRVLVGTVEVVPATKSAPMRFERYAAVSFNARTAGTLPVEYTTAGFEQALLALTKVRRYEGPLTLLTTPPAAVNTDFFQQPKSAILLLERQGVTLADRLSVDRFAVGTGVLPQGTRLDSYLIHLDAADDLLHDDGLVQGSITFCQPIAGVLLRSQTLLATDPIFGLPGTAYPVQGVAFEQRGSNEADDEIEIVDQRTIRFRLNAAGSEGRRGLDQFRVLTAASGNGTSE